MLRLSRLISALKNYALFPEVSTTNGVRSALRPCAPAAVPGLNLVGLAMRAGRKVIDKIVDGLKFHS